MEVIDPVENNAADAAQTVVTPDPGPKPNNHLVGAILSTVFCCLPFGIAAIIYAGQVDGLWYNGNHDAARQTADKARKWMWAGVICSVAVWFIYFAVLLSFGLGAAMMAS